MATTFLRSANPVLSGDAFVAAARESAADVMTVQGTATKTLFAVLVAAASAAFVWRLFSLGQPIEGYMIGGAIGSSLVALVIFIKGSAGFITVPLYSAGEGLFLGGLSAYLETRYPGIVIQAVGLTFGTLLALLAAYKARLVRATAGFTAGVVAATGAIALVYLVDLLLGLFGHAVPFIHESGLIGIGFSALVVVVAALNLVLDFDHIERGAQTGAPRRMEWWGAFGLLVTLVWLYLEVLNLLMKLQGGRRRVDA